MEQNFESNPQGLEMEARIWEYIDGLASATERPVIEKLVAENFEWKRKYQELLELHSLIGSTELDEPSMRFTKNVMEDIAKYHIAPAAKTYINKKIIWGIAAFFFTMILGLLVYGFGQIDWASSTNNGIGIDFRKVDYGKFFNNTYTNVFMMINVVLALVLLDRYFSNKKKQITKPES